MTPASVGRCGEKGADTGDSKGIAVENGVQRVQLSARQHFSLLDQRQAPQVPLTPGRRHLRGVVTAVPGAGEPVVPHGVAMVQNLLKIGTFDDRKICHGAEELYGSFLNVPPSPPV